MKLIKEEWNQEKKKWKLYDYSLGKWHWKMDFEYLYHQELERYLKNWKVELAIVELQYDHIEFLYATIPKVQIIVNPYSVYQIAEHFLDKTNIWQEEIASTVDKSIRKEKEEVYYFLKWFYGADSVEEAYRRYESWQCQRLLWNTLGNWLIDLFQLYEEEVFNYFKHIQILKGIEW